MYDVFLAHNSIDKPMVRIISEKLRSLDLETWLDEEKIPPGTPFQDQIQRAITEGVRSAAIFIGANGLGNWQQRELEAFLNRFSERNFPIIPVLLPGVSRIPEDLTFLGSYSSVTFENGIEDQRAIADLFWGITGRRLNQPPPSLKRGEIFRGITDATLYLDQSSKDPTRGHSGSH
jgi:hypothetical protein